MHSVCLNGKGIQQNSLLQLVKTYKGGQQQFLFKSFHPIHFSQGNFLDTSETNLQLASVVCLQQRSMICNLL